MGGFAPTTGRLELKVDNDTYATVCRRAAAQTTSDLLQGSTAGATCVSSTVAERA